MRVGSVKYEAEIKPTLHAKKSGVVNSMMVLFYSIRLLIEVLFSTILGFILSRGTTLTKNRITFGPISILSLQEKITQSSKMITFV